MQAMVPGVMRPASRPHNDNESSIHPGMATSTFTLSSTPTRTITAGSFDVTFADSFETSNLSAQLRKQQVIPACRLLFSPELPGTVRQDGVRQVQVSVVPRRRHSLKWTYHF
jgi:hypothetical protein